MEAWTPQDYSENSAPPEPAHIGPPLLVLDLEHHKRLSPGAASTSGSERRFGVQRATLQIRLE